MIHGNDPDSVDAKKAQESAAADRDAQHDTDQSRHALESANHFREILEKSPIGVALVTRAQNDSEPTGQRVFANDAVAFVDRGLVVETYILPGLTFGRVRPQL